jgi:hypothetical protein
MCKVTATQIAADGKAVGAALQSIANAVEATNPALSTDLTAAASTLVTATANWKTGTPVDDINTAANAVEVILAAIPQTAPYAVFVGIAVAALDILISNLSTQPAQATGNFIANARTVAAHVDTLPANPWRGQAVIQHHGDLRKGFEATWNTAADANPALGFSSITV